MLFQNAAQRERRMDPAVRDREVSLHAQISILRIDYCCILIELVCSFRTQHNVNGARTLLFGRARSAYCNKTQSMHVDDLFLLIEECLCAFSEWSDAQECRKEKYRSISRPPPRSASESTPRQRRHPLWLRPRPRLSVLHPPPGACKSMFPRLHQQQHFPRHLKGPAGLENESASPLSLQQRHRHHPCRHRRPRKHDGTASPTLRQQRHLSWWWPDCMTR